MAVYPHMPILRPYAAEFHERLIFSALVPQNEIFPAQDADEPPCKIWRR